jgi:hypothetical protein
MLPSAAETDYVILNDDMGRRAKENSLIAGTFWPYRNQEIRFSFGFHGDNMSKHRPTETALQRRIL